MAENLMDRLVAGGSYDAFLDAAYASGLSDGFPLAQPDSVLISEALGASCQQPRSRRVGGACSNGG